MSTIVTTTPGSSAVEIGVDALEDAEIIAFVRRHVAELNAVTPVQSRHALEVETLRRPGITMWSMRAEHDVVGCAALRLIEDRHAELKSMRVDADYQRQGLASRLVTYLIIEAGRAGVTRISLETGSFAYYAPARALYEKHGFVYCAPFGDHIDDPNSVFMTIGLGPTR